MGIKLTSVEIFCADHLKLSRWYEQNLGLQHERSAPDLEVLTDGATRIIFSKGKPDSYRNPSLFFTTDDFESLDRAICEHDGIRVQSLAIVEEDAKKAVYSALYEDIELNVVGLYVEENKPKAR